MIPEASQEQQAFLEAVATDHVLGDCVAGSGKTTTVLLIAKQFPTSRILQITYNSQLKSEVRAKVKAAGLTNLEIHTFHSLARAYYTHQGYDDIMIKRIVETRMKPRCPIKPIDIFVLDESQDIVLSYYCLLRKFLADVGGTPKMVVLGDRYQGIYGFKGADTRFLTLAPDIWDWPEFVPLSLTTSYRVTQPIAGFVNQCMLGYDRLKSVRSGVPVEYIQCNPFHIGKWMADQIVQLISEGLYSPQDVFVLAGSIKSSLNPARLLENALIERGIPCYFPTSEERIPDEDLLENKVVFSTFHQAKGRERAVVIIYGFDAAYFKYYGQGMDHHVCPETLYVGATRAKDRLYLLQSESAGPLPFLRLADASAEIVRVRCIRDGKDRDAAKDGSPPLANSIHTDSVTSVTRFLKESVLYHLTALVADLFEEEVGETFKVNIPSKIDSSVGCEDVSDINGLMTLAIFEARHTRSGMSTVETDIRNKYEDLVRNNTHLYIRRACEELPARLETVPDYLKAGVLYSSIVEQVYNRIKQIERFDWLSEDDLKPCFDVLKPHIHTDTIFEQYVEIESQLFSEFGKIVLSGRMDAVNEDCVWEIKCVDTVTIEHFLQVVLYAWIWKHAYVMKYGPREFRLLNVRTGQQFRLNTASHNLEEVVHIVFENKWGKVPKMSDEEFLAACKCYK